MTNSNGLRSIFMVTMISFLAAACDGTPKSDGGGLVMEFFRIPAGSFQMGSPDSEADRDDNEGPVHEVRITKPFYMGKYEVTQAQSKAVMGTTVNQQRQKAESPWHLKGNDPNCPLYYVSWEEAVEFCKRLGKNFRLPTEAEWEYACRAGSQTRFHYGDDPNYSELDQYAWYYRRSDNRTHPVGQKKPNAWRLYDMYGNVQEWCTDLYPFGQGYRSAENVGQRKPVSDSTHHVIRGGSWLEKPGDCRSASRTFALWKDSIGFRVVFAGKVHGNSEVLEIALPEKRVKVSSAPGQDRDNGRADGWLVTGVVRDEAGMPIDGVQIQIFPIQNWFFRTYATGEFEAYGQVEKSKAGGFEGRFVARHMPRNLVVVAGIHEATRTIDVNLEQGVILTGGVIGSDGKGVKDAKITTKLQDSDWQATLTPFIVEADAEGRFEMRALPSGYEYVLSARSMGYRAGRIEIHPDNVIDNRVDGLSIVLPRGDFSISGVVVDRNGHPVADGGVFCYGKNQPRIDVATDAEGKFTLHGVFKGQVTVHAYGYGLYGLAGAEAGATDIRIVLDKKAAAPPKGRACFPGETGVWVDGALVRISEVVKGQSLGLPSQRGVTAKLVQVDRIEEHICTFLCRDILLENGNRISVVDSHCFMLDTGQWLAAQDLRPGLRLKTLAGSVGIQSVTVKQTPLVGRVYNLKVTNSDCYAVGDDGVIVRDY